MVDPAFVPPKEGAPTLLLLLLIVLLFLLAPKVNDKLLPPMESVLEVAKVVFGIPKPPPMEEDVLVLPNVGMLLVDEVLPPKGILLDDEILPLPKEGMLLLLANVGGGVVADEELLLKESKVVAEEEEEEGLLLPNEGVPPKGVLGVVVVDNAPTELVDTLLLLPEPPKVKVGAPELAKPPDAGALLAPNVGILLEFTARPKEGAVLEVLLLVLLLILPAAAVALPPKVGKTVLLPVPLLLLLLPPKENIDKWVEEEEVGAMPLVEVKGAPKEGSVVAAAGALVFVVVALLVLPNAPPVVPLAVLVVAEGTELPKED